MEPFTVNKFTGNKQTDLIVLAQLDDVSLGRMCQTNQYFKELCRNEDFWRNRTLVRFGTAIPRNIMDKIRDEKDLTWREYYIRLVDFLEQVYSIYIDSAFLEEDESILYDQIHKNNSDIITELNERFDQGKWKQLLQNDLINPNEILEYFLLAVDIEEMNYPTHTLQLPEIRLAVKYILSLPDRRINFKYANHGFYHLLMDMYYGYSDKELLNLFINDPRHDK